MASSVGDWLGLATGLWSVPCPLCQQSFYITTRTLTLDTWCELWLGTGLDLVLQTWHFKIMFHSPQIFLRSHCMPHQCQWLWQWHWHREGTSHWRGRKCMGPTSPFMDYYSSLVHLSLPVLFLLRIWPIFTRWLRSLDRSSNMFRNNHFQKVKMTDSNSCSSVSLLCVKFNNGSSELVVFVKLMILFHAPNYHRLW